MSNEPTVIHCDNHLLVLDKRAGQTTQPTPHDPESLEKDGKEWLAREFNKPGRVFLEAVHRIDRPVSGVVLFARTSKALSRLQAAMREREITKRYLAVVEGTLPDAEGELRHFLLHGDREAEVVSSRTAGAKESILLYRTLAHGKALSLVEVDLVTGRYHQIRAQFAAEGCPLIGDTKYGSTRETGARSGRMIALHSWRLECAHPVGGARWQFTAGLPRGWGRFCPNWAAFSESGAEVV